jgi:hypothetical protein
MKTWVERLLPKARLRRVVAATIIVVATNILLHPLVLVPIFEPAEMQAPLYRSGAEILFALTWSLLAGLLLLFLCNYSEQIRTSLKQLGEIFGMEPDKAQDLYGKLTERIFGYPCFIVGLFLGILASTVAYRQVMEGFGGLYGYKSPIVAGSIAQVFFDYMLIGSALWVFSSYLYFLLRLQNYTNRLPTLNMLGKLHIFGITSLRGALFSALIGVAGLAYALESQFIAGGSGWSRILTVIELIVTPLFFFGSLLGVHSIIIQAKDEELQKIRNEYWSRYIESNKFFSQKTVEKSKISLSLLRMRELDYVSRSIEHIPEWPFDLGTLRTLIIFVIFPLVTYLLGNYIFGNINRFAWLVR